MRPTWKRLDSLVGQSMGLQLMPEVDASLLQHTNHFTRCGLIALCGFQIVHGWHDPCCPTFRVPAAMTKMLPVMQDRPHGTPAVGIAMPFAAGFTIGREPDVCAVLCLFLTDGCTALASCDAYPKMQDFPRRVVAHNVPAQGCHARLIEGRPQLGPLACSTIPLTVSHPEAVSDVPRNNQLHHGSPRQPFTGC